MEQFDIAIIGAGMAGASLAAEVGARATTVVLEAEAQPGYHATGRSAAFWEECYGGPRIVPLTAASGVWLREHGFLSERGALYLAREVDEPKIDAFFERFADTGASPVRIGKDALDALVPGLRPEWDRAIHQPRCADIDVAGLHQHYLAAARAHGVTISCRAELVGAERDADGWRVYLADGRELRADILVDAAGAWADHVAKIAGAQPLGIAPYRRTVVQLRVDPPPPEALPLCLDLSGDFYFRPESGKLWLSPHDETPSAPCDAAPEEIDVAIAIDRFEHVVDWRIGAVEHKWAGLRSFAPDRLPVYGFDPRREGFFWFAGQGGYGIQTAPAAARLAAQLLTGQGSDAMTDKLDASAYSPQRFVREMI